MTKVEIIFGVSLVAALAFPLPAQKVDDCAAMAKGAERTACLTRAERELAAKKASTTYTVTRYGCSGDIQHWQTKEISFASGGIQFVDTDGHRIHLSDNFSVESNSDQIFDGGESEE